MKSPFIIRMTIILILSAVTAFYFYIDSNARQIKDVSILQGNETSAKVALTFNMSWGNEEIYPILAALRKHDIRATFFLSGEWVERHQHIVELMQKDKHELAFIGHRYTNYLDNNTEEMKRDISYGLDTLKKLQIEPTYIRKPIGTFDEEMKTYVKNFSLQSVHYSLETYDTKSSSAKAITKQTVTHIKNGDIVLFHSSDAAIYTAEALQEIIPLLKEKKMDMVTLTELLQEIDIEEKVLD